MASLYYRGNESIDATTNMAEPDFSADARYFHAHGLKYVAPERLNADLKTAISQLEAALHGPSRKELTDTEIAMLERAGADLDEHPDATDPMLEYATEFAAIRQTSLTPGEVAQILRVTPVRVRQMIRELSLYAFRIGGRWHVPRFQLAGQVCVPNIERVNPLLADLDPVSVHRWITTPDPDLQDATPLGWLKAGRDVTAVLRVVPER